MRRSSRRLHEFKLIETLFAPLATAEAALGLHDDVALLRVPSGQELALTTDSLIEGIHFLARDPAPAIAQKALRVNLSDLAAKSAEPIGYLMALSLPDRVSTKWLAAFCDGLRADQKRFSVSLLGGDTTRTTGPLVIAITAVGHVPKGMAIKRSGARRGDLVFVSGTIGSAGLGLALLKQGRRAPTKAVSRYRLPQPRLALGRELRGIANAAIDVSDGLLADLGHIAQVSHVRIALESRRIPLSAEVGESWGDGDRARLRAATSGDDYEIAFTCRAANEGAVHEAAKRTRTRVTKIGTVHAGKGIVLLDSRGNPVRAKRQGYTHF